MGQHRLTRIRQSHLGALLEHRLERFRPVLGRVPGAASRRDRRIHRRTRRAGRIPLAGHLGSFGRERRRIRKTRPRGVGRAPVDTGLDGARLQTPDPRSCRVRLAVTVAGTVIGWWRPTPPRPWGGRGRRRWRWAGRRGPGRGCGRRCAGAGHRPRSRAGWHASTAPEPLAG
jgi:hypothetical protein